MRGSIQKHSRSGCGLFPSTDTGRRAAMSELTIWTYDWVPTDPRGFVRDLRLRWACEEAGLSYAVRTIRFEDCDTNRLAYQPFGQGPVLEGRRTGDIRKRRWTAAPGPEKRKVDAARFGWRSGNIAMQFRCPRFRRPTGATMSGSRFRVVRMAKFSRRVSHRMSASPHHDVSMSAKYKRTTRTAMVSRRSRLVTTSAHPTGYGYSSLKPSASASLLAATRRCRGLQEIHQVG